MPTTYKILGQKITASNTWTDLYVPSSSPATSSIVSSIIVCNTGNSDRTFSIAAVEASGRTPTVSGSISYNTVVLANDSVVISCGITLGPGNALRISGSSTEVGFSAFGTEIT
jgi:hypothetical protein